MKMREEIQKFCQKLLENGVVTLDTETTGLGSDAEVVEMAWVRNDNARAGFVSNESLILPTRPIPQAATDIHGITNEMVQEEGRWFVEVVGLFRKSVAGVPVAIFNTVYDETVLDRTACFHNCETLTPILATASMVVDVMELANRYLVAFAEWDVSQSKFKRLSLQRCCEIAGIEFKGQAHRACADATATMELIRFMADDRHLLVDPDPSGREIPLATKFYNRAEVSH